MSAPDSANTTGPVSSGGNSVVASQSSGGNQDLEYVAPFKPFHGTPLYPNYYLVTLHEKGKMEKHWNAIGENLGKRDMGGWYSATLSMEQIERIRRDPGVKSVVQYGDAVWG